jgi:hypothetical protein
MIAEAAKAIMQEYKSDIALKSTLTSGMFYEQATEDLAGNYCVFYIFGGSKEELMGDKDDCLNNLDVQFNLYSDAIDGGEAIASMKEILSDCYDWAVLNVSGYGCYKMEPISFSVIPVIDGWRQITVIYELGIQKE